MKLIHDVARGLHYLHATSNIHRDIKPENILLKRVPGGFIAKLGDFGLARDAESQKLISILSKGVGSSPYMSPEQHKLEAYGMSSDLWALGVTLYEMLAGTLPFQSPVEIINH